MNLAFPPTVRPAHLPSPPRQRQAATKLHPPRSGAHARHGWQHAVSLHCHTHCSKEMLTFIPHYAARLPLIGPLYRREMARYERTYGRSVDYTKLWWTPPLTPRQVLDDETQAIARQLDLPALISLTDHDDIEAGLRLQVLDATRRVPLSLEWTVPCGGGFFHFGIHNLPAAQATTIKEALLAYTRQAPGFPPLDELLTWLNEFPGVLIVLNHPLWDIECLGAAQHNAALQALLTAHATQLHALELNGYRTWTENQAVLALAQHHNLPVVSGGDRHGCRANSVLNLTRATSFDEFVAELREDKHSTVLLLPEYGESRLQRTLAAVADVLREYPQHPAGQRRWTERVFIDTEDKGVQPLAYYWPNGGPAWVRAALWTLRVAGSPQLKPAFRWATQEVRYEN